MNAVSEHKIKISQVIRDLLLKNNDVVSLVKDNVVPIVADETVGGDFITYKRFKYSQEFQTKMGLTSEQCKILIEVVSADYDRALEIGYTISNYLVGNWEKPDMRISMDDSDEDFKEGKYYQIFLFNIE